MSQKSPRPRPLFEEVAAELAEPVIRDWFEDFVRERSIDWLRHATTVIDGHGGKELSRLLRSVFCACRMREMVDGYHAARLFEDMLNRSTCKPWPVNARVVSAFQNAIDVTQHSAPANAERRWVLETGERVPVKIGDRVEFHLTPGDFDVFVGTVSAVDTGRARLSITSPNGVVKDIVTEALVLVDRRRAA